MGSIHSILTKLIQHTIRLEPSVSQIYSPFSIEFLHAEKKDRRAAEISARQQHPEAVQRAHSWMLSQAPIGHGLWIGSSDPSFAIDIEPTSRQISQRLETRLRSQWGPTLSGLSLWTVLEALYKLTPTFGPIAKAVPKNVETLDTVTWGTAQRADTLLEWANATTPDGLWNITIARSLCTSERLIDS